MAVVFVEAMLFGFCPGCERVSEQQGELGMRNTGMFSSATLNGQVAMLHAHDFRHI